MNILISNDDGVHAPGLQALVQALSGLGQLFVIVPDRNRSGASNGLTLSRPVFVQHLDNGYYCVDGTPTDCVHLAMTGFFEERMDLVVSGINHGSNLADDVLYSGTVAAAMEGHKFGLPAFAVSLTGDTMRYYSTAAAVIRQLVVDYQTKVIPNTFLFNVNVPDVPLSKIAGMEVTRLGARICPAPAMKVRDPRGRELYWIGPAGLEADAGPGTDFYAINQSCVSLTPLQLNLTANDSLTVMQKAINKHRDMQLSSESTMLVEMR